MATFCSDILITIYLITHFYIHIYIRFRSTETELEKYFADLLIQNIASIDFLGINFLRFELK